MGTSCGGILRRMGYSRSCNCTSPWGVRPRWSQDKTCLKKTLSERSSQGLVTATEKLHGIVLPPKQVPSRNWEERYKWQLERAYLIPGSGRVGHLYIGSERIEYPKNSYKFPKKERKPPFWHVPQPRGTKATSPVFIPRKILPSRLFFHPCSSSTSSSLRGFRGRKLSRGGGLGDEGEKAVKLATELATFSHYGYLSLSKFSWRRGNPQISGDIRSLILD